MGTKIGRVQSMVMGKITQGTTQHVFIQRDNSIRKGWSSGVDAVI